MVQLYRRKSPDQLVNTTTESFQDEPDVAVLAGGGYVVTWADPNELGTHSDRWGIKAQRFDSAGNKLGGEFVVNTRVQGDQTSPSVAALQSGGFVIAWEDYGQASGYSTEFRGQLFEADGDRIGGEFLIGAKAQSFLSQPRVTGLAGGGFVVTWISSYDSGDSGIKAQLFDSSAAKIGGVFSVNTATAAGYFDSSVAALPSGGFVVAWTGYNITGQLASARFQLFDSAGAKIGPELAANGTDVRIVRWADVAAFADGFVVTWAQGSQYSTSGSPGLEVRAQKFDLNGAKSGGELIVRPAMAGDPDHLSVASLPGGGFVVTWQGPDARGQIFDSAGGRVGVEFAVSSTGTGEKSMPRMDTMPSGEIVVVWRDGSQIGGDSSSTAVKSQILTTVGAGLNDILLTPAEVNENAVENFAVANLSTSGAINSPITYEFLADSAGGAFRLEGDRLVVADNARLDFETVPQVSVTVRATDANGQSFEDVVLVDVTDVVREKRFSAGDEKRVNVNESGAQSGSTIVPLTGGGFAMVWNEVKPGTTPSTLLRLYDSSGEPRSGEIRIADRSVQTLSVEALADGGFAVVRSVLDSSTGQYGVKAQRYDSNGGAVGAEMVAGSYQFEYDRPALIQLDTGGFLVAWQEHYGSTYAQRFDSSGVAVGAEFSLRGEGQPSTPSLVATSNGGFAASWISREAVLPSIPGRLTTSENGREGMAGVKFFDSANAQINGSFNEWIVWEAAPPTLLALAGGGLIALWWERTGNVYGHQHNLKGHVVSTNGYNFSFPPTFASHPAFTNDPLQVSFAAHPGGGFVATWPGPHGGTQSQLFDALGAPVGVPFLDTSAPWTHSNGVSALANGSIVTTWTGPDSDGTGVFVRIFRPANEPVSDGNDVLTGNSEANRLDGLGGDDRLYGLGGNDVLIGGAGNDILDGGPGADRMEGGPGNDFYHFDNAGDSVVELAGEGSDTVATSISYALRDNIENLQAANIGGTAALALSGNGLNNFIWGTQGNNVIDGGGGADFMIGYAGDDSYQVDNKGDIAYELDGGGSDTVITSIDHSLGANIENLQSANIGGSDPLSLTGNALNNFIWGTQGNNIIDGGAGADFMIGYAGNDTYHVDHSGDIAYELDGGGTDTVATLISYTLAANVENLQAANIGGSAPLSLTGNALGNFIWATQGNNVIDGGAGADFMIGYGGNDVYFVDNSGDVTFEEAGGGEDTVAALASYALGANIENLQAANIGGTAALSLTGNDLGNFIWGTQGANVIAGRGGNDRIYGYGGADQFLFNTAAGNANFDWLDDFQAGVDKIVLDNSVFTALVDGALPSSAFVAGTSAADADDRIIFNAADGSVSYDADGNGAGAALLIAYIPVGQALTAADFVVV